MREKRTSGARGLALCLAACLLLSGCAGGKEGDLGGGHAASAGPVGSGGGIGRNDPTPSPLSTLSPTPSAPPTGPVSASPEPSDAPASAVPSEPVWEPKEGSDTANYVAGEDYDFTQPVPESLEVGEDYFADAVFIGDSRTEGFRLYSGLKKGTFLAHTGLSIFNLRERNVKVGAGEEEKEMLALDALEEMEEGACGKVYVSLGVNELGMYNDKGYYNRFSALVDDLRETVPQAVIYLQLLIPVNTQKCSDKKQPFYVTNEQIQVYNDLLHQVAEEKQVFLVDPAQAIVDETGEPPYEMTADGVHFNKEGYRLWYGYLKTHTVDKGDWT